MSYLHLTNENLQKKKENLSINISIKSRPVFLSASRSSVAKATSVPKVYPSRRRRSGCCSMITGFAGPKTILKQIFKRLIIFYLNTHTHTHTPKKNIKNNTKRKRKNKEKKVLVISLHKFLGFWSYLLGYDQSY